MTMGEHKIWEWEMKAHMYKNGSTGIRVWECDREWKCVSVTWEWEHGNRNLLQRVPGDKINII